MTKLMKTAVIWIISYGWVLTINLGICLCLSYIFSLDIASVIAFYLFAIHLDKATGRTISNWHVYVMSKKAGKGEK